MIPRNQKHISIKKIKNKTIKNYLKDSRKRKEGVKFLKI
jgi:hypothetical protein